LPSLGSHHVASRCAINFRTFPPFFDMGTKRSATRLQHGQPSTQAPEWPARRRRRRRGLAGQARRAQLLGDHSGSSVSLRNGRSGSAGLQIMPASVTARLRWRKPRPGSGSGSASYRSGHHCACRRWVRRTRRVPVLAVGGPTAGAADVPMPSSASWRTPGGSAGRTRTGHFDQNSCTALPVSATRACQTSEPPGRFCAATRRWSRKRPSGWPGLICQGGLTSTNLHVGSPGWPNSACAIRP
jgi:hypothetical protein